MKKIVGCILPVVLSLSFVGCFGTEAKDEFFYQLSGPTKALEKGSGPKLLLATFSAAAGYDTPRIAIRNTKHEILYYGYRQWAAEPTRILAEMTEAHLRASGKFSEVTRSDRMREPDAVLEATINAVEQVDHKDSWDARLAMTIVVRKGLTEQVVLRHAFDAKRPCERRHPDEVAKGVSKILESEISRLAPRIAAALR
jgi:ABC-type uncharacterized transport system auxiliary subunit